MNYTLDSPTIVGGFNLIEYLAALDVILNVHSKWDKLLRFSHNSLDILKYQYGVPEPFDKVVFAVLSLIAMIIMQKILARIFRRTYVDSSQFKFNMPDFSEVGIMVQQIKKMNEELNEIKKSLGGKAAIEGGHVGQNDVSIEKISQEVAA